MLSYLTSMKDKCDLSLLTQPPSPPEDPPPKEKDSNGSKKPSSKGKAAAGSQQVDVQQVSSCSNSVLNLFLLLLCSGHLSAGQMLTSVQPLVVLSRVV